MAWHPFRAIASALRQVWDDVARSQSRRTPNTPIEEPTPPRYQPPRREPTERYDRDDEMSDDDIIRERAIERVRGWNFEHFNEPRLRRQLYGNDILNSRVIVGTDKEGFRQLASTNPSVFGYH
jgi:hypothetical protein